MGAFQDTKVTSVIKTVIKQQISQHQKDYIQQKDKNWCDSLTVKQ